MQNAVFHLDADRVAVVGVLVDEEGRTCYSVWVREHLETAAADWSYVPVIGQLPTPTADVPGVGPAGSDPTGPRIVLVGSPQATRNPNPGPPTRVTGGPGWSFPEQKWRSGPCGRPISKFLLSRIPAAGPVPAPADGGEGRPDAGASGSSRFTF